MRTCPACGEDTEAGYSEPCTECGFSAMGDQEQPATAAEPAAAPGEQPKKRGASRLLIWLVVIAAFFGAYELGIFDQPTGPSADEAEAAIADSAKQFGVEVTVECPDAAEDTAVDATFTCTATNGRGRSVEVVVTNHEENYEWDTGPLSTLAGRG